MRINTQDLTLARNYLQKYYFLISEYELVKQKQHQRFRYVKDFYRANDTDKRSFLKYYNRYKQSGNESDLLPQKRGPKWKSRRPIAFIENKVIELREKGNHRYEIHSILRPKLKDRTPSPSGIYNICKRHGLNRLQKQMKQEKRKIIKTKAGELGHLDCHYLRKGLVKDHKRLYLVCIIDSCSRIAWAEVVEDIQSLTVMFACLKSLNILSEHFGIKFAEVLTDNGPEFGIKNSQRKAKHPFERMLIELGIMHRYTRFYRPQTNGKVERLWRTIEEDLLYDTYFDSIEELKEELLQYIWYYNYERPHQGLGGIAPAVFLKNCPRIS